MKFQRKGSAVAFCLAAAVVSLGCAKLRAEPAAMLAPEWSEAARQRVLLGPAEQADAARAERRRLLDQAEAALRDGDSASARQRLERAALMLHAPDTEAALVRADLQAGEYRRALAFAAHAAGAHKRQWPAGMAMYAWLLSVGGQQRVAEHLLAETQAQVPDNPELEAARIGLENPWPVPEPILDALQLRPYALGEPVPAAARSCGAAVLLPDGTAALTAAALLEGATTIWLRDGTGRTVIAERDGLADAQGVQRLRLRAALPSLATGVAVRPPFAGSPGYVLDHAPGSSQPAWPLLRQGFFGAMPRDGDEAAGRVLGFELPAGPRGGPVFDAEGLWAGLAVTGADGVARMVPASRYLNTKIPATPADADAGKRYRPAPDEIYELALRQTLQLLVLH